MTTDINVWKEERRINREMAFNETDILGGKECGLTTLYKYESKDESKLNNIIPDASFNEYSKILSLVKKIQV